MAMISCESDQVLKCTKSLNQPLQSVPTSVFALDPKLAKFSLKVEMQTNWSHHLPSKKTLVKEPCCRKFEKRAGLRLEYWEGLEQDGGAWGSVRLLDTLKQVAIMNQSSLHCCRSQFPPNSVKIFSERNKLADSIHTAFYYHFPLCLSPDAIWITIVQGLYIDNQTMWTTILRKIQEPFFNFEGKKHISIMRPDCVKGSPANDWTTVFPEFWSSQRISGWRHLECDFSTTTPTQRIDLHIVLMDMVLPKSSKLSSCSPLFQ